MAKKHTNHCCGWAWHASKVNLKGKAGTELRQYFLRYCQQLHKDTIMADNTNLPETEVVTVEETQLPPEVATAPATNSFEEDFGISVEEFAELNNLEKAKAQIALQGLSILGLAVKSKAPKVPGKKGRRKNLYKAAKTTAVIADLFED